MTAEVVNAVLLLLALGWAINVAAAQGRGRGWRAWILPCVASAAAVVVFAWRVTP